MWPNELLNLFIPAVKVLIQGPNSRELIIQQKRWGSCEIKDFDIFSHHTSIHSHFYRSRKLWIDAIILDIPLKYFPWSILYDSDVEISLKERQVGGELNNSKTSWTCFIQYIVSNVLVPKNKEMKNQNHQQ